MPDRSASVREVSKRTNKPALAVQERERQSNVNSTLVRAVARCAAIRNVTGANAVRYGKPSAVSVMEKEPGTYNNMLAPTRSAGVVVYNAAVRHNIEPCAYA